MLKVKLPLQVVITDFIGDVWTRCTVRCVGLTFPVLVAFLFAARMPVQTRSYELARTPGLPAIVDRGAWRF